MQEFFPLCNLGNEKTFFLKADTTIIEKKTYFRMILKNKDAQYWDRSVVFSTLSFYESWYFWNFLLYCIKYFQLIWRMFSIHLSITNTFLIFDVVNFRFKFSWWYQIYLPTLPLPPNRNVLCSNERSLTRSHALTLHMA